MPAEKPLSPEELRSLDSAIRLTLSRGPLNASDLLPRLAILTSIPASLIKATFFREYLDIGRVVLDRDLQLVLANNEERVPQELWHKKDLCGQPHVPIVVGILPLNGNVRCKCCGAVLVLDEYSFVTIDRTMAIPRLFRLICPECP